MKASLFLKIVTIINLLVATGFSIAGIINPHLILPPDLPADKAVTIYALYAGARTIPLAIAATLLVNKTYNAFITIAVLAGVIQFLDGFIGIYQQEPSKYIGPFVISLIEFAAIYQTILNNRRTITS